MSIRISNRVWATSGISSTEKLVLLNLADHANDAGERAFPSVATIAAEASLTRRGVQKALRRLAQKKFIKPVSTRARSATVYAIELTALEVDRERRSRSTVDREPYSQSTADTVANE